MAQACIVVLVAYPAGESLQVRDYLFSRADLNLTRSDSATVASNILYMMELLPPPKAAAVAYLDSGGAAPLPPRQAWQPLQSRLLFLSRCRGT